MTTIDVTSTQKQQVDLADGSAVVVSTCADEDRVTITAWDEPGDLVGLAWFELGPSGHPRPASVEVTPPHRMHGIGTALLRHLIAEAGARGVATLTWTHPADDIAVRHLEAAGHAPCARRVERGQSKSRFFLPAA